MNLFLVIDVIVFKKTMLLRSFFYKISSKVTKLNTNFEGKPSFIIKMSKYERIKSVLEDENDGTEESGTSDDEYLSLRSCNRACMNDVFQKSM